MILKKMEKKRLSLTAVQQLLTRIPAGKVTTYQEIARALGHPKCARGAGNLLNKNTDLIAFPCFKVVRSDGKIGGYALGEEEKKRRLKSDGVSLRDKRISNFRASFFSFSNTKIRKEKTNE